MFFMKSRAAEFDLEMKLNDLKYLFLHWWSADSSPSRVDQTVNERLLNQQFRRLFMLFSLHTVFSDVERRIKISVHI